MAYLTDEKEVLLLLNRCFGFFVIVGTHLIDLLLEHRKQFGLRSYFAPCDGFCLANGMELLK